MARNPFFFSMPAGCLLQQTQEELMRFQMNHFIITWVINNGAERNPEEVQLEAKAHWESLDKGGYLEGMKKDMLAEVFDHAQSHAEAHESILTTILGSRFGHDADFEDADSEVVDDKTVQKAVKAKRLTNNKKKYDA